MLACSSNNGLGTCSYVRRVMKVALLRWVGFRNRAPVIIVNVVVWTILD